MNNLRGVAALLLQALLLRARRQRPNDRRAAQKHDELAPPHELPSDEAHQSSTLDHKHASQEIFPLMSVQGQTATNAHLARRLLSPSADIFPSNRARHGLPTIQGAFYLADAGDGRPLALLDSIEITLQRTEFPVRRAGDFLWSPEPSC
jgi:hypothetical protein